MKLIISTPKGKVVVEITGTRVVEDYQEFTGKSCFKAKEQLASKMKSKRKEVYVEEKPEAYVEEEVETQTLV